jgi:hypothetical protein
MDPKTFEVLSALTRAVARIGSAVEAMRQQMPPGESQDEVASVLHDALQSTREAIDVLTAIANRSNEASGQ